jgi:ABC-2 type transport system permease protein
MFKRTPLFESTTVMIPALVKAQCLSLLRDRMALLLSFALPCVMFSVFAVVFGGGSGKSGPQQLKVLIADLDQSEVSAAILRSLGELKQLKLLSSEDLDDRNTGEQTEASPRDSDVSHVQLRMAEAVQAGKAAAAIIIPSGMQESFADFSSADRSAILLIHDPANPLAEQMLTGLLQASAFTSAPTVLLEKGLDQFRRLGGPFSLMQESAVQAMTSVLGGPDGDAEAKPASEPDSPGMDGEQPAQNSLSMTNGLVRIESTSAREIAVGPQGGASKIGPANMISYYAAGIAVMFIMFSMSGASCSLLEHQERGTLERMLSGRMTIQHLLAGHWIFYVTIGVAQISLMLIYASLVFGLDLWSPETLVGAGLMALTGSMASASFIMMLATFCRTRRQLEGFSSIVILTMSAIGGSMMPRFIMPEFVIRISSVAFNSWALDGFLKVFWYRTPGQSVVVSILPEMAVLIVMAGAFMTIAFRSARRWAIS